MSAWGLKTILLKSEVYGRRVTLIDTGGPLWVPDYTSYGLMPCVMGCAGRFLTLKGAANHLFLQL